MRLESEEREVVKKYQVSIVEAVATQGELIRDTVMDQF